MLAKTLETTTMPWFLTRALVASSPRCLALVARLRSPALPPFSVPRRLERKRSFCSKAQRASKGTHKTMRTKEFIILDSGDHSHIDWWMKKMEMCKKPSAVQLVKRLVGTNLLGLDEKLKNGSLKEGTLNFEILQLKAKFPREVLLCRVGDFYEAIGFDACILVEYAGLNPFGGMRSDSIPKAGCPVVNLRQTLDCLTCCGYSVCIVEEVLGPTQARSRKSRFISGHAHPGSPYVFGLAGVDEDVDFPEPMPVVGISRSAKGYCIVSVLETMKTFSEEDGLTEEAIVTKLRTCQYHHLFLHTSLRQNASGTSRWGEFGGGGLLWGECKGKSFEWFDGDTTEEILCKVREIYGLDHGAKFRNITVTSEHRPQPLYLGTATQIGVIPTEGIPCLLKELLPLNCVGLPALYIRDLLLNPPPYAVASAIQDVCKFMANILQPLPEFTCISAPKLVKLLESKEVNHAEFCRIKDVVDGILQIYNSDKLSPIHQSLLKPTWLATGLNIEPSILVKECELISCRIGEMIFLDGEKEQKLSSFECIPRDFFDDMESSWKGRVKKIHAEEAFTEVERAAIGLSNAVTEDFLPIVSRTKSVMSPLGGVKAEISYAREHGSVWFKGRRFRPSVRANTYGEAQIEQLVPATDSKGRKVGEDWYTTVKVEDALNRYHEATSKAKAKVLEILRELSAELQSNINVLVFSSTLLVVAKALFAHVSEGRRKNWSFPKLVDFLQSKEKESIEPVNKLELKGLSPYWFDPAKSIAVHNDISMQSLFLLTGPNGGGKSSLLRSICAASLLGICGLMVPAGSAVIPHFDAVRLHMKSYDSPVDGKSSFQIEMSEISSIVTGATSKSLVLLDEICRGTETVKGTCIAGSIIERIDDIGCLGIISTHLHGIFDLPLSTENVIHKAMGTEMVNGCTKPTWKLVDGICRESLAFETAKMEGVPENIINRAEELYLTTSLSYNDLRKIEARLDHMNLAPPFKILKDCTSSESSCADIPSFSMETSNPMKNLRKEVENAILEVCREMFLEFHQKGSISELPEISCYTIGRREQPPPSTIGTSSVYILFRPDNSLYVGQTDDLFGRVQTHRSKAGLKNSTFLYVTVPGKSVASQLETLLINQLPLKNFRLVNRTDGRHRNFGTSKLFENVDHSVIKDAPVALGHSSTN